MGRRTVLILANMTKPGVSERIESLRGWFAQRAEVVAVLPANNAVPPHVKADVCIVFGGDGTFLCAARSVAELGIPLLGVNMGKLGFLAEYDIEHLQRHFDDILSGAIAPSERMMLAVQIRDCQGNRFASLAANDVAISSGPPFRMIDLNVSQNGGLIARYVGDGLIISTPVGSTGYNMSAGGPILEPPLDAIVITPVAPHSLSVRPLVINGNKTVSVTTERVNAGSAVIIDGQVSHALCDGAVIEVRKAARGMKIIPHPGRTFFGTLSSKLHWGQSPHHHTA